MPFDSFCLYIIGTPGSRGKEGEEIGRSSDERHGEWLD